jgi:hypothetical protein
LRPGYFYAWNAPIEASDVDDFKWLTEHLLGRDFTEQDDAHSPLVAMVSRSAAEAAGRRGDLFDPGLHRAPAEL